MTFLFTQNKMASADVDDAGEDVLGHLPLNNEETFSFTDGNLHDNFIGKLHNMRSREFLTDVELKAGDRKIRCHKNVLAAVSPYFLRLFEEALRSGSTVNCVELRESIHIYQI